MSKPKHVYLVIITRGEKNMIVGCFYDKEAAQKWTGGDSSTIVQKIAVS